MFTFFIVCLIIIAAYVYGRYTATPSRSDHVKLNLSKNYFVGLNYLLNEQNDKALNILIKSLSVDSDTIETHLALGSLFRRRGELTRAIRIHQNLIARPNLSSTEIHQATLALAYDYLAAGMLDRAEQSFWQVCEDPIYKNEALYKLIDIYQRERRWLQAIEVGQQLIARGKKNLHGPLAHFYCERAEVALKQQQADVALKELALAKKHQKSLARIYLLMGAAFAQQNQTTKALEAYQMVQEVDADYLSEAIPKIVQTYRLQQDSRALHQYLERTHQKWPRVSTSIALAEYYAEHQGLSHAIDFLKAEIHKQPSLKNLLQWIQYEQQQSPQSPDIQQHLTTLHNLAQQLIQQKPVYRCQQCGFAGRILFWQCPGCKHWGSIKPIHGVEGDG